ncbi:hypothetical protein [Chitinophaga sp. 22620]|uniref:hypothetical protein n=1 Tax=Chitinophaga sp. 22620 TaxID=3453952 RepID=UPI003F87FC6D
MDNTFDFKIASVNRDLRLCIIENSIFVEELASRVLGNILNIDWKTSRSFGHASTSLSFFQKLQLIQDIKGIEKDELKKLTCLANIRNKFAHVSEINCFKKLFSESSVGKEIQKCFLNWYFDKDGYVGIHPAKVEFVNRLCFYLLVNDVISILIRISDTHLFNMGVHEGKREVQEQLLIICMSVLPDKQREEVIEALEKKFVATDTHS